MKTYAQNYQKLMSEKGQQVEAAFKMAIELATNYRLKNVCGDDGDSYPLIDMLTLEG